MDSEGLGVRGGIVYGKERDVSLGILVNIRFFRSS